MFCKFFAVVLGIIMNLLAAYAAAVSHPTEGPAIALTATRSGTEDLLQQTMNEAELKTALKDYNEKVKDDPIIMGYREKDVDKRWKIAYDASNNVAIKEDKSWKWPSSVPLSRFPSFQIVREACRDLGFFDDDAMMPFLDIIHVLAFGAKNKEAQYALGLCFHNYAQLKSHNIPIIFTMYGMAAKEGHPEAFDAFITIMNDGIPKTGSSLEKLIPPLPEVRTFRTLFVQSKIFIDHLLENNSICKERVKHLMDPYTIGMRMLMTEGNELSRRGLKNNLVEAQEWFNLGDMRYHKGKDPHEDKDSVIAKIPTYFHDQFAKYCFNNLYEIGEAIRHWRWGPKNPNFSGIIDARAGTKKIKGDLNEIFIPEGITETALSYLGISEEYYPPLEK